MKIWHLPDDGSRKNLYGSLLRAALRARGHTVQPRPHRHLFALEALRARPDVVHFEAIAPFLLPALAPDAAWRALLKGPLFLAQAALLRLLGCRLVWTIHNDGSHDGRLRFLEAAFSRAFTRLCSHLVVHGEAARARLSGRLGLPAGRLRVLFHPSYLGAYPDTVSRHGARARLGLPATAPMLLAFGMLRPYKGLLALCEAFAALPPSARGDARLWIVGEAADAPTTAALRTAAERIPALRLVDRFVPEEEVQLYFRACDAVVLPYRRILTSGAALLAMTFARPCVAPRLGCLPEVLEEDANFLYDPGPGALAAALETALRAEARAAMGQRNRARAERLSWEALAARLEELYAEEDACAWS